jgi:ribosomal protein L39E
MASGRSWFQVCRRPTPSYAGKVDRLAVSSRLELEGIHAAAVEAQASVRLRLRVDVLDVVIDLEVQAARLIVGDDRSSEGIETDPFAYGEGSSRKENGTRYRRLPSASNQNARAPVWVRETTTSSLDAVEYTFDMGGNGVPPSLPGRDNPRIAHPRRSEGPRRAGQPARCCRIGAIVGHAIDDEKALRRVDGNEGGLAKGIRNGLSRRGTRGGILRALAGLRSARGGVPLSA